MNVGITRRYLLQGTAVTAAFLATPNLLKAGSADEITIGYFLPAEEQILYPARLSWIAPANIVGMCLEPLVRIGAENHLDYVLADAITGDPSGLLWSISVRSGVTWQGAGPATALTAEHVAANIRHWCDDHESSLGRQLQASVKSVTADGHIVKVELKSPNFQFLYVLTAYAALIMHPDDGWTFHSGSQRTGPFKMVSYKAMEEARFEPSESYWNPKSRALRPVRFVQDSGAADQNFDFIPQLDPDRGQAMLERGIKIKQNALADALIFHMDCQSGPLQKASVRQALRACLNPDGIIRSIYDYGRPADHTHASAIHGDYPEGYVQQATFQPDKVGQLLEGQALEVPLHYSADNVWQRNAVEAYVKQAAAAGITIVPTPIPRDQFDTNWDKFPGLTSVKWIHRPLGMQLYREVYHSSATWNLSGWKNKVFDQHVEALEATPLADKAGIDRHMKAAMAIMQNDGPMLQAAWIDCNKAYDPRRLNVASVRVGSGGHIYANLLRTA